VVQNAEDRFNNLLFYGIVLSLAYLVFRIFEPFLVPLGWATVFAVIFNSLRERLEHRWGRTLSAISITGGVTLILIVPMLLLGAMFVRQGVAEAREIQAAMSQGEYGWFGRTWEWLVSHVSAEGITVDLPGLVRQNASRVGEYLAAQLGTVIRDSVVFLLKLGVTLLALFFFLRDGDAILDRLRRVLPFEETAQDKMLGEARELIFASVTASLAIAAVQATITGGAFAILGIGSPVFWGVVGGFLSLLPGLGTWPIWVPAAVWLFSTGHAGRAIILVGICGGFGVTVDNILRPALLRGRTSLNGLLVFISVLGGITVFGVLGIVLGPIVVATAVGILDVYSRKGSTGNATGAPVS